MIDKMLKANKDLFDIEKKIRAEREKEKSNITKGGAVASESDQGVI